MKSNKVVPVKRSRPDKSVKREIMFHGIPASPGIVYGEVLLYEGRNLKLLSEQPSVKIAPEDTGKEQSRFLCAVESAKAEIHALHEKVCQSLEKENAALFDAHYMILEDRTLLNDVRDVIEKDLLPAEYAFSRVMQKYIHAISAVEDSYLKERVLDLQDVAGRVLSHLQGTAKQSLDNLPGPRVISAPDLPPSETVSLNREYALGFAIESGSRTCHTAIIARSMRIPAIVGLNHFVEWLENGDKLILDGFLGIVILNPDPATVALYEQKIRNTRKLYEEFRKENLLESETLDGYRIRLCANVDTLESVKALKGSGAAGIGLFRTEYLFMDGHLPPEEEQFEAYKEAALTAGGGEVIIRTLDIGGDKLSDSVNALYHEQNPFLGLRAIRLCLERPEIFKTQIRAILRAGLHGNIKMMFPMISSLADLENCLAVVEEVKEELREKGIPFHEKMQIGIMIEIPSAALIADVLAQKVDFFSIGTNDLIQYTLAADRINEHVARYYQPTHPAVLRLIAETARASEHNGIWSGVCGEMAGDLYCIPILLGLGVEELSMSPMMLGHVRRLIRRMSMKDAERIAEEALKARTPEEALRCSASYLEANMPEILAAVREG